MPSASCGAPGCTRGDTHPAIAAVADPVRPAAVAHAAASHETAPPCLEFADADTRSSATQCLAASATPSARLLLSAPSRSTTACRDPSASLPVLHTHQTPIQSALAPRLDSGCDRPAPTTDLPLFPIPSPWSL